ncbi:MAG: type II secretion system protein M [Deltaproteobacteria bacterium]|nr:type II secretion system protein M [Deltaproteobacteria bacterium]
MRIGRREKIWIGVGCAVVVVMLAYGGVIYPTFQRMEQADRTIKSQKVSLEQIRTLREEWLQIQADRDVMRGQLENRGAEFSMFRYLEGIARQAGVESQIQYMRPLPSNDPTSDGGLVRKGLEVRLAGVGLDSLVRYLYLIEYSDKLLSVESIHAKAVYTSPDLINVTFRVFTLEKA